MSTQSGSICGNRHLSQWSSLPPETLGDIFLYVRDTEQGWLWLRSTHVCASWRSSALDFALLWISMDLRHRPSAPEMIRRARGAPITLHLPGELPSYQLPSVQPSIDTSLAFKTELLNAMSPTTHIRHIDFNNINVGGILTTEDLAEIIAAASPRIQTMRLQTIPNKPSVLQYDISSRITGAVYPLLETLYLCDCEFDSWGLPFIAGSHNLRSLTIKYSSLSEKATVGSLAVIRDVLCGLPRLQHLFLGSWALPDYYEQHNLPLEAAPVALPFLAMLEVHDDGDTLSYFLHHLQLPRACRLRLASLEPAAQSEAALLERLLAEVPSKVRIEFVHESVGVQTFVVPPELRHAVTFHPSNADTHWTALGGIIGGLPASTEVVIHIENEDAVEDAGQMLRLSRTENVTVEWTTDVFLVATTLTRMRAECNAFERLKTMTFVGLDFSWFEMSVIDLLAELRHIATFRTLRLVGCDRVDWFIDEVAMCREAVPELIIE